jgi:predicted Zn-dependent protease
MVAFAEVTSFVRFFIETSPEGALAKLLVALRATKSVDDSLKQVSGETLAQWDVKWRAQLGRRAKEPLSALYGLGGAPPGLGDSRERSRLGELLLGRGHPNEALVELEKIPENLLSDPSLRYIRGRVLEAKGDYRAAEAVVEDPKSWIASFGPCWALRSRLARTRGDTAIAESAEGEALAHDPFAIESACRSDSAAPGGPLCDAARKRDEPDLGKD